MKKKKFDKDFLVDQICVVIVLIASLVIMVMAWRVNHPKKTADQAKACVTTTQTAEFYNNDEYCKAEKSADIIVENYLKDYDNK